MFPFCIHNHELFVLVFCLLKILDQLNEISELIGGRNFEVDGRETIEFFIFYFFWGAFLASLDIRVWSVPKGIASQLDHICLSYV